jgi:hypothetical protein
MKDKDSGKKKPYVNSNKETTCNNCKKKGYVEKKCWKKNPELIPDKVKATQKKWEEKKAKKTSAAATAFEDEGKMVLTVLDLQKDDNKFSCFNMNDAVNMVLIDKGIMYLKNIFEESDNEESDDKE